jgi:hypothetical protein
MFLLLINLSNFRVWFNSKFTVILPVSIFEKTRRRPYSYNFLDNVTLFINKLIQEGIPGHTFECRTLVHDAVARCDAFGIIGHSGKDACPHCDLPGMAFSQNYLQENDLEAFESMNVFYPMDSQDMGTPRTDEKFRRFEETNQKTKTSFCELDPSLDLILDCPSDPMHSLHLGYVKKVMTYFKKGRNSYPELSEPDLVDMERITEEINDQLKLVGDFDRVPRTSIMRLTEKNLAINLKSSEFKVLAFYHMIFYAEVSFYHIIIYLQFQVFFSFITYLGSLACVLY